MKSIIIQPDRILTPEKLFTKKPFLNTSYIERDLQVLFYPIKAATIKTHTGQGHCGKERSSQVSLLEFLCNIFSSRLKKIKRISRQNLIRTEYKEL